MPLHRQLEIPWVEILCSYYIDFDIRYVLLDFVWRQDKSASSGEVIKEERFNVKV